MNKTISIMMIMVFLVGSLPIALAFDDQNDSVRQIKAGMPIVFRINDDSDDDNEDDDSDDGDDDSNPGSGGSSGGNGGKKRVTTTAQNTVQNAAERLRLRQAIKAKVNVSEFMQNLTEKQEKVFSNMLRAQKNKILEMNMTDAFKAMNQYKLKPVNESMMFKKRNLGEENKIRANLNYGQAVSKYAKLNSIYKGKKATFHDIKEQLRNCTGVESEDCNQLRNQGDEAAKEYLLNGANMTLAHLEKLKSNIEGSEYVDTERAENMLEKIDEAIAALEEAIAQAEAAETKDELKDAAKIIQNIWNRFKNREKVYSAELYKGGVWNIMRSSEHLEQRLDNVLEDMEEQGINVSDISAKVDLFSEYIFNAKNKYNNATDLLEEAKEGAENEENVSDLVEEAKTLLREAHQDLKDAHRILIDIIQDIKEAGGNITEDSEPEEDELYEIVEDEDDDDEDEEEDEEDDEDDNDLGENETEVEVE